MSYMRQADPLPRWNVLYTLIKRTNSGLSTMAFMLSGYMMLSSLGAPMNTDCTPTRESNTCGTTRKDHRRTAFFGVSPIQCTSVNLTDDEIELFKKSVRGTLQGAIRVDVSIERLVAGLTGKESTMSVEDFLRSDTTIANTVAKHYGSLVVNCREKPVCFYAQWPIGISHLPRDGLLVAFLHR